METSFELSKNEIQTAGLEARSQFKNPLHNCGDICDRFISILIDKYGLPFHGGSEDKYCIRNIRVGPSGEEKHYIVQIDGALLKEFEKGDSIWIDLSLDQFNDKNLNRNKVDISYGSKEDIENIQVISETDERRCRYQSIDEYLL